MDLIAACRAFVSVADRGGVTAGAAAERMQQSVASRRIAALERQLGEPLLDRTGRRAQLTAFGRSVLPAARGLVRAAAELDAQARRSRSRVVRIALPELPARRLGRLLAGAEDAGMPLDPVPAGPAGREEALRTGAVQAAVLAVPPDAAEWQVALGVAGLALAEGPLFLDTLRPSRGSTASRRLMLTPEDDVPALRDRLFALRDTRALGPEQIAVAGSPPEALAAVEHGDLLLAGRAEARELGLQWRPLGDLRLVRGYAVAAGEAAEERRLRETLGAALGACLAGDDDNGNGNGSGDADAR